MTSFVRPVLRLLEGRRCARDEITRHSKRSLALLRAPKPSKAIPRCSRNRGLCVKTRPSERHEKSHLNVGFASMVIPGVCRGSTGWDSTRDSYPHRIRTRVFIPCTVSSIPYKPCVETPSLIVKRLPRYREVGVCVSGNPLAWNGSTKKMLLVAAGDAGHSILAVVDDHSQELRGCDARTIFIRWSTH